MKVKRGLAVFIRIQEIRRGMSKRIKAWGLSNLRCSQSISDH